MVQQVSLRGRTPVADPGLHLLTLAARELRPASSTTILGIIGFDALAQDLALRAHRGFGMQIIVYSPGKVAEAVLERCNGLQVPLSELLRQSDIVSLHGAAGERPVMTGDRLDQMKPDAVLISGAGAGLIDERALAQSLMFDTIAGAAILVAPGQSLHPMLAQCDRLVTLPSRAPGPVLSRTQVA